MENDIGGLWDEVQFCQELHDRLFHGDIYNLTKPHRLTHLVLHHCKYVSKIYGLHNLYIRQEFCKPGRPLFDGDEDGKNLVQGLCVDGMVVGLSMLNVANKSYSGLRSATHPWAFDLSISSLIRQQGVLAKTIEDIDHMAQTNPIGEVVGAVQEMMKCYTSIFSYFGDDERTLVERIYDRLNFIEEKNIYGDRLQAQMLMIINEARERKGLRKLTAAAARIGS
ncbi:hypothetical protein D3C76_89580 [compost metagenome]